MSLLRKLSFLAVLLAISFSSLAEEKVVSALPVLHSLNQALLEGTDITPIYLPPKRLPVSRISNWIKHKSRKAIANQGAVTAFTTVESIWPNYSLFPHLRTINVRVIPIDAAKEIIAGGSRIRVREEDLEQYTYFWLEPENLIVMSQIMARDYGRIWPDAAVVIRENQSVLEQKVRNFALELDQLLLERNVVSVCIHNSALRPLADATGVLIDDAGDCSADSVSIVTKMPIQKGGNRYWMVDHLNKPLKVSLDEWLTQNLLALKAVLVN